MESRTYRACFFGARIRTYISRRILIILSQTKTFVVSPRRSRESRRETAGMSREKNCANEFTVITGSGFYGLDYHTCVM